MCISSYNYLFNDSSKLQQTQEKWLTTSTCSYDHHNTLAIAWLEFRCLETSLYLWLAAASRYHVILISCHWKNGKKRLLGKLDSLNNHLICLIIIVIHLMTTIKIVKSGPTQLMKLGHVMSCHLISFLCQLKSYTLYFSILLPYSLSPQRQPKIEENIRISIIDWISCMKIHSELDTTDLFIRLLHKVLTAWRLCPL